MELIDREHFLSAQGDYAADAAGCRRLVLVVADIIHEVQGGA